MNYDQPRQLEGGPRAGKWHYTRKNDRRIWALGYCSPYQTCSECGGNSAMHVGQCDTCESQGYVTLDDMRRCPGHDTPDEARLHYRAYLLDHHLYLDGEYVSEQRQCEVCGDWTQGYAELNHTYHYALCDEHRTRLTVELLVPAIGDSIHS